MAINIDQIKSVPATFMEVALERGERIAIRHKAFGLWQEVTWKEYYNQSAYLAHALISLGVEQGDFIGIIGENCPEWFYMDMGIQMAGARTVGIYTTNSWKQVEYIVDHSSCKILFAENEEQVDKWLRMKGNLDELEYVIYWDKKGLTNLNDPQLLFYDDIMKVGRASFLAHPQLHIERTEQVDVDDAAILVYTSGTTGHPKGAVLTSKNLLWVCNNIKIYSESFINEKDKTMSFLPLCHIFERLFSVYLPLILGYTVHLAESTDTIVQNIKEIRPTVGYAVPRVWEKFQSNMKIKMSDAPWINQWAYKKALKIGRKNAELKLGDHSRSIVQKMTYFIAYWSVLHPLKFMMGMHKMKIALSGAAPISPEVLLFYHSLGITMLEGYGMTETAGIITMSTPSDYKLGTVGKPMFESELQIAADGEILVRHPGVISGYYKNPEASENAIQDGWMQTGDVGVFDEDGYLKIIDRKKDIIITAGGKNIAPQKIENKLKVSSYINDAIIIGDKRKFISAIIVLDEDNINKYAQDHKIQYTAYSDLATQPEIVKLITGEVSKVNKELANVESIKKFEILDKRLYVEDGDVTPTMKVKRKSINDQYAELIESMYH